MSFEDISYLELWRPFCSAKSGTICAILVKEQLSEIILNLDQWFGRESLKDIFYLELWQPLCSGERTHLCNFGRWHHDEQFCEIIFVFGPVVQEMLFKIFLI